MRYSTKIYSLLLTIISACVASVSHAQVCKPVDKPDIYFTDNNKDGIDGDTLNAVFVSASGNDANTGTINKPVATLHQAMTLASASGKDIYISKGTYTLSSTLTVADGISIFGLFSETESWERNAGNKVTINGPQNVLLLSGHTRPSMIAGLEIIASDASIPGQSSQAIIIEGCTGMPMFIGNTIKSGRGANGQDGSDGLGGQNGGAGGSGGGGACDALTAGSEGTAGISPCGQHGGKGGLGGVADRNGIKGQDGLGGNTGGGGGKWGDPAQGGADGTAGTNGTAGNPGTPGKDTLILTSGGYVPVKGNNGTDGTDGTGGGGGGGGGGQSCLFCTDGSGNGGGGGGGGGCKGRAGTAGSGGGASIGIAVINSRAFFENNTILTQAGGNGGDGGNGGTGGTGNTGGLGGTICTGEVGKGGKGGDGGNGGAGAGGSGGNGGPSLGIAVNTGSQVYGLMNTVTLGSAGKGGFGGGTPMGTPGANGIAGKSSYISGTSQGFAPEADGELCIEDIIVYRPASGNAAVNVHVHLSQPSPKGMSVSFAYTNGTAAEGTDFELSDASLTFNAYSTQETISFTVLSAADTSEKTFTITLSNVSGSASLGKAVSTVRIKNLNRSNIHSTEAGLYGFEARPNPFSQKTDVHFRAPVSSSVKINLYDATGKLLETIFDGMTNNPEHTAGIDGTKLESGLYFYSFTINGSTTFYQKLILLNP